MIVGGFDSHYFISLPIFSVLTVVILSYATFSIIEYFLLVFATIAPLSPGFGRRVLRGSQWGQSRGGAESRGR